MRSTLSLPLLSGPLCPGMVSSVRVPFMHQIEIFYYLLFLKPFNCVKVLSHLKILLTDNSFANHIYLIAIYLSIYRHMYVCTNRIKHLITYMGLYAIKHNQQSIFSGLFYMKVSIFACNYMVSSNYIIFIIYNNYMVSIK